MTTTISGELTRPGLGGGFRDLRQSSFLLKLLVRKELKVRYRGSVLGLLWSYVKPGCAVSRVLRGPGRLPGPGTECDVTRTACSNYAVYLFSGIVLINFFSEALGNSARSIVNNGNLIKKIYLPRELFPVASVWVSAVHFFPQLVVLVVGCVFAGWHPDAFQLLAAVGGFAIVGFLATGLGLLFGAANVYFRDSENLVDMLLMVATWASPVMYSWTMVQAKLGTRALRPLPGKPHHGGRRVVPLCLLVPHN